MATLDLDAVLVVLDDCADEAWYVQSRCDGGVVNLGEFVSVRACLSWIQHLPRQGWTSAHIVRLQTIFKTLLAKATFFEDRQVEIAIGYDDSHLLGKFHNFDTRLELAQRIHGAREIEVPLWNVDRALGGAKVVISRLLLDDAALAQFERFWSPLPSMETSLAPADPSAPASADLGAAPAASPSAPMSHKSALPEASEAWLRLRACKLVEFTLRCSRPFVDWINGKTFAGVEFDWVKHNANVDNPTATPLVGRRWSSRQIQVGVGSSFADEPTATQSSFVCTDFQLVGYAAALDAAWSAWQAPRALDGALVGAPPYAVGPYRVQAIGSAAPLLVILKETPGDWLEWHPDLAKPPQFAQRSDSAWLAELHKLEGKAPLDRVRMIAE